MRQFYEDGSINSHTRMHAQTARSPEGEKEDKIGSVYGSSLICRSVHICVFEKGCVQGTSSVLCEVMGEVKLRGRSRWPRVS